MFRGVSAEEQQHHYEALALAEQDAEENILNCLNHYRQTGHMAVVRHLERAYLEIKNWE